MKDRPLTDFDKTVLEQMEHIRAVGRRKLRNQNDLDDFVQETIARVYANRSQLRDPAKLKQWIAGIARNVADDWNRAHYRRAERALPDEAELVDERDPLDALEQAERNEQIRQAMNRLNPVDRDLLRGRYMDEESYDELQNRHGLSYSAVGIRLHRAKQRLKKILQGMKIALVLPLINLTRNAFGGILLMRAKRFVRFAAALSVLFLVLCLSASAQNGERAVEPWIHPGWIGGILGSALGILGGVVGALTGALASRGKAVKLTLGVNAFAFALSFVSLIVGIAAFLSGQPYGVWFGFGYGGLLGAIIFGVLFPVIRKRAREAEHRKSMLEDITRSLENTENRFLLKIRAMLTKGALTPSEAKELVEAYEESRGQPPDDVPT